MCEPEQQSDSAKRKEHNKRDTWLYIETNCVTENIVYNTRGYTHNCTSGTAGQVVEKIDGQS